MRLIYSGKTKEFTPELEERITGKLAKLSKLLETRGEREAHITHCMERHLHRIELVVNFYDHPLVAEGLDSDLETALCGAAEKLEGIALKARSRWRDNHRDSKTVRSSKENWDQTPENETAAAAPARSNGAAGRKPRVFRVNYDEGRKPMTLEEAMLEIEKDDYVVYRDSEKNCLSVLLRRPDGNYDLIES